MNNTYGALSSVPDNAIIDNIYDYVTLILSGFKGKRTQEALVFFTLPVEVDADGDIEQFESVGGFVYRFK